MIAANQTFEQRVRDKIDRMLQASGWLIQSKKQITLAAGVGVAVREYMTDIGPADYILFVRQKLVGVIEANREEGGLGRMWQLFGEETDAIINELNESLIA